MEKDKLVSVYNEYWSLLESKTECFGELLKFDAFRIPSSHNEVNEMFFYGILNDGNRELVNGINGFIYKINKIETWGELLERYEEVDKLYILEEFANPLVYYCANQPYALYNRIIYVSTILCHQSNSKIKAEWREADLSREDQINFNTMKKLCSHWSNFQSFSESLEKLRSTKDSPNKFFDLRSKMHHRIPPNFEIGHTEFVKRDFQNGKTRYIFGGTPPLIIKDIVPELKSQCSLIVNTYHEFCKLVEEMLAIWSKHRSA